MFCPVENGLRVDTRAGISWTPLRSRRTANGGAKARAGFTGDPLLLGLDPITSLPVQFSMVEIARLLGHFNLKPKEKGSFIYYGVGRDGRVRRCRLDYHKDRDTVAKGTAAKIAKDLLFSSQEEMRRYIDEKLK